jgi:hypothetical protein
MRRIITMLLLGYARICDGRPKKITGLKFPNEFVLLHDYVSGHEFNVQHNTYSGNHRSWVWNKLGMWINTLNKFSQGGTTK